MSDVAGIAVDAGAEALLTRRPEGTELIRAVGLGGQLVPAGTSNELSGPSIALIRLSSRGENPTTSVPGAAMPTHGPATLNLSIGAPDASTAPTVST